MKTLEELQCAREQLEQQIKEVVANGAQIGDPEMRVLIRKHAELLFGTALVMTVTKHREKKLKELEVHT